MQLGCIRVLRPLESPHEFRFAPRQRRPADQGMRCKRDCCPRPGAAIASRGQHDSIPPSLDAGGHGRSTAARQGHPVSRARLAGHARTGAQRDRPGSRTPLRCRARPPRSCAFRMRCLRAPLLPGGSPERATANPARIRGASHRRYRTRPLCGLHTRWRLKHATTSWLRPSPCPRLILLCRSRCSPVLAPAAAARLHVGYADMSLCRNLRSLP